MKQKQLAKAFYNDLKLKKNMIYTQIFQRF